MLAVAVREGLLEACSHLLHRFDSSLGYGDQAEDDSALFEQLQQTKVGGAVCIFYRNGINRCLVERLGEFEVGGGVGFVDILVRLIEVTRTPTAEVNNALHLCRHAGEAAFEVLDPECRRFLRLASEYRFVDLDVATAGFGQRPDLNVEGVGEVAAETPRVFVVLVGYGVAMVIGPGTVILIGCDEYDCAIW